MVLIGCGGGGGWGRGKSLAGVNRVEPSWIFSNLRRDSAVPAGPRPPSPEPRPCHPPQLGRLGLALLRCPRFPLPCQPPSPAQRLVLRTNRPSLAGALARPQKAWVSFDTAEVYLPILGTTIATLSLKLSKFKSKRKKVTQYGSMD